MNLERIDKIIGNVTGIPRSEIKTLIKKKRIRVDDNIITDSGLKIDQTNATIYIDNEPINCDKYVYYMLYKPEGYVSATNDNVNPTVISLIKDSRKDLFPVGRLDKDTTGLLIITNDGMLSHMLLSPSKHVDKVYEAVVDGPLDETSINEFKNGLDIGEDKPSLPAKLEIQETSSHLSKARVTIHEGKFHQVKRMFEAINLHVLKLHRISMGPIVLDSKLEKGEYRPLSEEEINSLKEIMNAK